MIQLVKNFSNIWVKTGIEECILANKNEYLIRKKELTDKYKYYEKKLETDCHHKENQIMYLKGYCKVCQAPSKFLLDYEYGNGTNINFRERLVCQTCSLNNRQRFLVAKVMSEYSPGMKIYMYEYVTPVYKAVEQMVDKNDLIGSEYLGDNITSGTVEGEILHEDATSLSFEDDFFDIVVSNDVFEHVFNYQKAFSEAYRVLKPGGRLFMTIPFYALNEKTEVRAYINESGTLQHIKGPQYHGNPIDPDTGSLVVNDFGWDILDLLKRCGFDKANIFSYYGIQNGYLGCTSGFSIYFKAVK